MVSAELDRPMAVQMQIGLSQTLGIKTFPSVEAGFFQINYVLDSL